MSPVLATHDLSVRFGGVHAVSEVDIVVEEGQLVGLIGPNGAGKTTFVDAITGYVRYAGRVGTGMSGGMLAAIRADLESLERSEPAVDAGRLGRRSRVQWVEPVRVAEVAFTEWTGDGRLRHPSFVGMREDKPARQVRRERPAL